MGTETVLLISAPQDFVNRFNPESLGIELCEAARQRGGAGWARWLESGVLKLRIRGVFLDEIRTLLHTNFTSVSENSRMLSVVAQQTNETPWPDVAAGEIPWETVHRQKLTEKFLRLLPEGVYVTSDLFNGGEEIFSERLGPLETRETTWCRAALAGANNRLCRLFWTEDDFNRLSLTNLRSQAQR